MKSFKKLFDIAEIHYNWDANGNDIDFSKKI